MKKLITILSILLTIVVLARPNNPPNPGATASLLTWNKSTSLNVVSNVISVGLQANVYTRSILIDNNKTNYTVTGLTPNTRYVFVIRAIDSRGNQSANSAPASYRTAKANGNGLAPVNTAQ